jgi:hypothetical protein
MPVSGRAAVSSGTRHSRRASRSGIDQQRRDKTQSSQSYAPRPLRDSSSQPAVGGSGTTQAQRPSRSRSHSTSFVPRGQLPGPENGNKAEDDASNSDPGEDEEIADDPFFQRFEQSQTERVEEELRSPTASQDSDAEGPLSPTSTQMRHRPDSTAEPLGSPLSPRSPISVCILATYL